MGVFKNKSPGGVFSSFKATEHSERLRNTFEEVQAFKRQLLKAETGIKLYAKATDEVLRVTDDSVTAFPRAWRKLDTPDSPNAAGIPEDDLLKPAPTGKKLTSHPSNKFTLNLETALNDEVYTPIGRWHKQYQHIKTRIGQVETSRIEYDAARKDLGSAKDAQLKHTRKTDGKVDATLQSHEAQAEAQLNVKRQAYLEVEEQVHSELLSLVADSQAALDYISRALHLHARALAEGADAVQERETSLPHVDRRSSGTLSLGSPMGTPTGTPVGTPTGVATSFRSPNFDTTPEQVAQQAASYRSSGTPLGDSTRMGRFDESEPHDLNVHPGPSIPHGASPGGMTQSSSPGGIGQTASSGGIPKTANTADVSGTGVGQAPASASPLGGTTPGQSTTPSVSQLASGTVDEKRMQNTHDHDSTQTTTKETDFDNDGVVDYPDAPKHSIAQDSSAATNDPAGLDTTKNMQPEAAREGQTGEEAASGSMLPEFVRKWVPGT